MYWFHEFRIANDKHTYLYMLPMLTTINSKWNLCIYNKYNLHYAWVIYILQINKQMNYVWKQRFREVEQNVAKQKKKKAHQMYLTQIYWENNTSTPYTRVHKTIVFMWQFGNMMNKLWNERKMSTKERERENKKTQEN